MVKLFVGNISSGSNSDELRRVFEKYGKVTECEIIKDFAFVHIESAEDADKACTELNGYAFGGKSLNVQIAKEQSRDSHKRSTQQNPMDIKCFNCGMTGHRKNDCPRPANLMSQMMQQQQVLQPPPLVFSSGAGTGLPPAFEPPTRPPSPTISREPYPPADPILPPPLPEDRDLEALYERYLIARDRYYYYRDLLEHRLLDARVSAIDEIRGDRHRAYRDDQIRSTLDRERSPLRQRRF